MPIVGGRYVTVDGDDLVDGGMIQQIPFRSATDRGATHVLILLTRREAEFERKKGWMTAWVEKLAINAVYGPALASLYETRGDRINSDLKQIFAGKIGVEMDYIARPATDSRVRRFTLNADALKQGAKEAYDSVLRYVAALEAAARVA